MKILHVTKKYPNAIGGDAVCVFNLEKEQVKRGHEVFILTTNCREIVNKENLYKFGLKDISSNWDIVTIKRILSLILFFSKSLVVIKKTKPAIIHSHSSDLGFIISIWAKFFGIPVINTCHGISFPYKFLSPTKRYSEWFFLKFGFFDKITISDFNSEISFKRYGLKNYQYVHIAGVDIDEFEKIKRTIYLSNKHKYPKFIFVGRIDPLKGLDYLLCAVAKLKEHVDYFEVWIIGDGFKNYKDKLKILSQQLKIEKHIKFFKAITQRERLIKMYCMADVFVLPSLLEGFPLTILEAWAAKLAVITTNVGGIRAICTDRENALIIPSRDVSVLSLAMLILIKDKELGKKIGLNGQHLVENNYTWDIVSKNLEYIYKIVKH